MSRINFNLERFKVIKTEDITGPDSPFLWVFGIHIDKTTIKSKKFVVEIDNPGHRNISNDLNDGDSVYIPADVGHLSFEINNLSFIGAIVGIIVIAFDEDSIPENNTMKKGYWAASKRINDYINNELISGILKYTKIGLSGISIDGLVTDISSKIEKASSTAVEKEMDKWEKTKAFFSGIDKDDKIGSFSEFTSSLNMENKPFPNVLNGDGARYKITGSISNYTLPTISKKIKGYKWSEGWTYTEFYEINNKVYLMLLKKSNGVVHIHEMNSNGTVGKSIQTSDWASGWMVKPFKVNNKNFIFLIKESNGDVCISNINSNGTTGKDVIRYNWSNGWTSAEFYEINNKVYLILLKKSNGVVHIHEMNSNGTVGKSIQTSDWASGWMVKPFKVNNKDFIFLIKESNGDVCISKINSNGSTGKEVIRYNWKNGWSNVEFYEVNNKVYLFLLKRSNGVIHIHEINENGTVGRYIDCRNWSSGWNAKLYNVNYKDFLFLSKSSTGTIHIREMMQDIVSFNSIKDSLEYGDIVLFSTNDVEGEFIKIPTDSKWSHVGIVYESNGNDIQLLEAIPSKGVWLTSLSNKIKNYNGSISIRKLEINRTSNMKQKLKNVYKDLNDLVYELPNTKGAKELAFAGIDNFENTHSPLSTLNKKDLSQIFCSELIAEVYQKMGLLSSNNPILPSNEFTPKDFSSEGNISLLNGKLLEEIKVK